MKYLLVILSAFLCGISASLVTLPSVQLSKSLAQDGSFKFGETIEFPHRLYDFTTASIEGEFIVERVEFLAEGAKTLNFLFEEFHISGYASVTLRSSENVSPF